MMDPRSYDKSPDYGFDVISEAYQKGVTANTRWHGDHTAEDTFELPPRPANYEDRHPQDKTPTEEREYRAEFGERGEAFLVLDHTTTIASFDTFADAQLAAEALNNHKGY